MPERWSRRALLASLGTAALAGCTGRDTEPTPTPPSVPPGTPDPPDSIETAWPVPGGTPAGGNYNAAATGPTDPVAPLWETDLDTAVTAPVVADGRLFVAGAETLSALDARTGDPEWSESVPPSPATPRVVDDTVYLPTADALLALSTVDGSERWRRDLPGLAAVVAADHGVYALVDVEAETSDPATVVAVDRDGQERWRTDISRPWTAHLFASESSVFVSSGGNGTIPWQLSVDGGDILGRGPTPVTDSPHPRFYRDGTVFSTDVLPAAVDARPATGADGHEWRERISVTGLRSLSGDDDTVYCVAPGDSVKPRGSEPDDGPGLYALGLTDGSRVWSTTDIDADTAGRPVLAAETVVIPTADLLHCFDPADGTERWAVPTEGLGRASLAVVDDMVYATADETVRAYRPP